MLAQDVEVLDITDLRQLIYETLCEFQQLEPGAFPMTERILVRGDRPCGVYFCLHGPRSVMCTCIWETDRNTILFYGHDGQRFHKTYLSKAPQLAADHDN